MSGHAQLKFVMTECSKTQIRLTGLICVQLTQMEYCELKLRLHGYVPFTLCDDVCNDVEFNNGEFNITVSKIVTTCHFRIIIY